MTPRPVLPLPGPLHQDPTSEVHRLALAAVGPSTGAGPAQKQAAVGVTAQRVADAMLFAAFADLELGEWDAQIVNWLRVKDVSVVATLASLARRCFEAGARAGRAEVVDEVPLVGHLRASVAALEDDLRDRNARVGELLRSRDVARGEVEDLRAAARVVRDVVRDATSTASTALDDEGADRQAIAEHLIAVVRNATGGAR